MDEGKRFKITYASIAQQTSFDEIEQMANKLIEESKHLVELYTRNDRSKERTRQQYKERIAEYIQLYESTLPQIKTMLRGVEEIKELKENKEIEKLKVKLKSEGRKKREINREAGVLRPKKTYESGTLAKKGIRNNDSIKMQASWSYPGAEVRFGKDDRDLIWQGPARLAYLLFFAPLACTYVQLPSSKVKKSYKANWAFLLPQVVDLHEFEKEFLSVNAPRQWFFEHMVSGIEDAVLKYAAKSSMNRFNNDKEIIAVGMGTAGYYVDQQKTRKYFSRFHLSNIAIKRFECFEQAFPTANYLRTRKLENDDPDKENTYIYLPSSREQITANIFRGRPWYERLCYVPYWQRDRVGDERKKRVESISIERLWFDKLRRYEWRQLMNITNKDEMWDDPNEKEFVDVMYRTLRSLLDKEELALQRGGSRVLHERWDDKVEDVRRCLTRAKTMPLCREVFANLFAKAGGSKQLTEGLPHIWGLVNDRHEWTRARDLALFALVTFTDGRLAT